MNDQVKVCIILFINFRISVLVLYLKIAKFAGWITVISGGLRIVESNQVSKVSHEEYNFSNQNRLIEQSNSAS